MSGLVLTLRTEPNERLDAAPLAPGRLRGKSAAEVAEVFLRFESGRTAAIGDLFEIDGTATDALVIAGDGSRLDNLGYGMTSGTLVVDGTAGRRLGTRMAGGSIEVTGDAGDWTGVEMSGGRIVVRGSVGRGAGSASPGSKRGMTGGELIVLGNAGSETGACMRRGLIAVAGGAGPDLARAAIAGTVLVSGDIAGAAGRWSKRASVIALGEATIPATYRFACTFRPPHVALLLTYIKKTCGEFGGRVPAEHVSGRFDRFSGDHAESGAGEILRYAGR